MKAIAIVLTVLCLGAISEGRADSLTESVQQTLKEQGFYYGEVTGKKDADTTAAIRRYQIRNGLQVTGELNAATQKSLGIKGSAPAALATPTPPRNSSPQVVPDLRDDEPEEQILRAPAPSHAPVPREILPENSRVFGGTPYERASPDLQVRVIVGAQTLLARQGYYRSGIDGIFGPGMEFALRAYQTAFEIEPSGRLDMPTLAALGLLPGQRAPGVTARRQPYLRRPGIYAPRGERVYTP